MERVPEHELMDNAEQARAYADTDFSEPHEAFVSHFRILFPNFSSGRVLDMGCGTADVTLRFARAFPKADILGIDGAEEMLDVGTRYIRSEGLSDRIELRKQTIPDRSLLKLRFDCIISNSLLHHLKRPETLWQVIDQCAKPFAPVLVMDLFRPDTVEDARELVKLYAADASPILQNDFYNSLLASYRMEEIKQQLSSSGLDYLKTKIVSDRHIIIWGSKRTYG
jgi:ubiquinone/menaquinone biosynthesis C-methylase UbiE